MALKRIGLCLCLSFFMRAAPAQGVVLGGTNVPKDKIVVYILIGHSNMAGIDLSHSDDVANPMCWNYRVSTKAWVPAKEPKNSKTGGLSGNGAAGPGMPFLKGMSAAYPDYYFGVVTNASLSATCRGENTGNNGSNLDPSDNRYWDSTYLYTQIVGAAKAIQKDVTLGGILCMLGTVEATRTSEAVCRAFSDDITELVKDIRRDLAMPNLPFVMGEYEAGATAEFSPTLLLPGIIQAQTRLIPGKLPFSALVDSKGIAMLDNHHYTGDKGQQEWARRAVAVIQANKFFPGSATGIAIPYGKASAGGMAAHRGPWTLTAAGAEVIGFEDGAYRINGAAKAGAGLASRPLAIKASAR
ncbi:MAG: hypothetical protein JWP91_3610 [Fibrobacteres bacterium]|nr:hypothetical protein [Fibrobacterota bacterium]